MERTAEKWVVWEQKKKNPETTRLLDFSIAKVMNLNHCTEQGGQCW